MDKGSTHRLTKICLIYWFSTAILCCYALASFATSPPDFLQNNNFNSQRLTAEQAFQLQIEKTPTAFKFRWHIAPNYLLYRDQIKVVEKSSGKVLISESALPIGMTKEEKYIGTYQVFANSLEFTLPLQASATFEPFYVEFQGCAIDGFCYAPMLFLVTENPNTQQLELAPLDTTLAVLQPKQNASQIDWHKATGLFSQPSFIITLAIFFVLGMLQSLTLYGLPFIPIVMNFIFNKEINHTKRIMPLVGTFVLCLASTYAIAGIIANSLGHTLQAILQTTPIISCLSAIILLLAMQKLQLLRTRTLSKLAKKPHTWQQQKIIGAYFLIGFLGIAAALIISPFTTPPLAAILTYLAQDGSISRGAIALFILGLGIGVPLLLLALIGTIFAPKLSNFSVAAEKFTGILLLGLAIWLLQRVVSPPTSQILWGSLAILISIYLGAFNGKIDRTDWERFWKGLAILFALYGATLVFSGISGGGNPKNPLNHIYEQSESSISTFFTANSLPELKKQLTNAQISQKPAIVFFSADWCMICDGFKQYSFTTPMIAERLARFHLIEVDLSILSSSKLDILEKYQIFGPPALLVFTSTGQELTMLRTIGDVTTNNLLNLLNAGMG